MNNKTQKLDSHLSLAGSIFDIFAILFKYVDQDLARVFDLLLMNKSKFNGYEAEYRKQRFFEITTPFSDIRDFVKRKLIQTNPTYDDLLLRMLAILRAIDSQVSSIKASWFSGTRNKPLNDYPKDMCVYPSPSETITSLLRNRNLRTLTPFRLEPNNL